jgi:cell filamentation protein
MSDDPYVYPGTAVLRNKLNIRDADQLDYHEREIAAQRIRQGVPAGKFDLKHLKAIHRHIFQDIYDWAGEIRTVEIAKGGSQFQFRRYIETGMADVHRRLVEGKFLRGLDTVAFARAAGEIMGDVNYCHPFREGNGRTQLQYLKQLAAQAGHPIDLTRFDPEQWIAASRAAHKGDYALMGEAIAAAMGGA